MMEISTWILEIQSSNETFIWEPEHEKAFEELKSAMTQAPVMKFPERSGLFLFLIVQGTS